MRLLRLIVALLGAAVWVLRYVAMFAILCLAFALILGVALFRMPMIILNASRGTK